MDKLEFTFGDKNYYVSKPTQADINDAELVYKIKYSEAVRHGTMTSTEAQKIIEKRDLWTVDDQDKVNKLVVELNAKGKELLETKKLSLGGQIMFEMKRLRDQILALHLRRNSILDNTAESYADDHRIQYYVVACVFNEDETKAFKDLDAYLDLAGTEFGKLCLIKTITQIAHEGQDFRDLWPETQWRKQHGLIDDDYNPIKDKMDQMVKETLAEAEKKDKPTKKQVARKRKTKKKTT